ncbi:60S ribosomal subunit assembly/export protein, partial [Coniosporium uncinatum]
AELNIPKLNGIVPAGVQKPKGKKKGKVFVDDQESMMTILAMVNAEKEGAIESKMMRARQMEEIREARQKEAEAKAAARKEKLEDTKNSLRKRPKRKADHEDNDDAHSVPETATKKFKANRKRVSFG